MGHDLATRAELVKLARALGTTPEQVAFAATLDHHDVRRLRVRVEDVLYDEHRAAFQRVATFSRLLPTPLTVRIALRAFSPMLAARVAGEMSADRAAELADRMPIEYLAEGCVHLDPRRAGPLLSRIRRERVLAVVSLLVERGDFITLGRLLDAASNDLVGAVAATVSDDALLRIGVYTESDRHLTRAVAVLPPARLRAVVHHAVSGDDDLRSAGLSLIGRLTDGALRARLADHAAEAPEESLTRMLHTAIADTAVPTLLTAINAMGPTARRRVLSLPALRTESVVTRLREAAPDHPLWAHFDEA